MINQTEPTLGAFGMHSGHSYSTACLSCLCKKKGLSQGGIETVFPCLAQTGKDEGPVPSCSSLSSVLSQHWTATQQQPRSCVLWRAMNVGRAALLPGLIFSGPPVLTKFLSMRKIRWVSTQLFSSYSLGVAGSVPKTALHAEWKAESWWSLPLDLTPELNLIVMGREALRG